MKKIIVLIILFLVSTKVNASEVMIIEERIPSVYYNYTLNGVNHWGRFFRLEEIGEETVFCITPGVIVTNNQYEIKNHLIRNYLTFEQERRIKLIAYYGYYFTNRNTDKYLLATQKMIWEELGVENIYFTTEAYSTGEFIDLEDEIELIEERIRKHQLKPSFDQEEFETINNERISLHDENRVINQYFTSNSNVIIDNFDLYFENISEEEIVFNKIIEKDTKLYYANNSQILFRPGTEGIEVNSRIFINPLISEINIYYEENPILNITKSGAQYNLYNEEGACIETLVTNEDEEIHVYEIPIGKYTLVEKIPGEGFDEDENSYEIEITKEEYEHNLFLEKKVIKRPIKITINKFNINSEISTPLINYKFEIYKDEELLKTLLTDDNGVSLATLPYGNYKIKSESIEDFEVEINISSTDPLQYDFIIKETSEVIDFEIPNTKGYNYFYIFNIIILLIFSKRKKYEKN